nr:PKD domain-containing protein [Candidatus Sigynarchaeota archaeon]
MAMIAFKIKFSFVIALGIFGTALVVSRSQIDIDREFPGSVILDSALHGPIAIVGNAALDAFCAGNGTTGASWATAHVIKNMEIDASSGNSGMSITDVNRFLVIQNCTVFNAGPAGVGAGILLVNCTDTNITGCRVYSNGGYGVRVQASTNVFVKSSQIHHNQQNVYLSGSTGIQVRDNSIHHCGTAYDNASVYLGVSSMCTIQNNTIATGTVGILLDNSGHNMVIKNSVMNTSAYSITLDQGDTFNSIANNSVISNLGFGITGNFASNNTIDYNDIRNNVYIGLYFFSSDDNNCTGNNVTSNQDDGVTLESAYRNRFCANMITGNTGNGVYIWSTNYNVFDGNTISSNGQDGAYIAGSPVVQANSNEILNNDIAGNAGRGVELISANYNLIQGNTISGNNYGYFSQGSNTRYNTVCLNNFLGNTGAEAYDMASSTPNYFDNGTRGNYWINYQTRFPAAINNGTVWNTPYAIDGTSPAQDNYPLAVKYHVTPVADFTANRTSIITGWAVQFNFTGMMTLRTMSYQWSFGDGTANATAKDPVHVFNSPGYFTITLTASDSSGAASVWQRASYIYVQNDIPASAEFYGSPRKILVNNYVWFNFNGTGNGPLSYQWSFGDATGNETWGFPSHYYYTAGNFTVTLTIVDMDGDASIVRKVSYVEVLTDLPVSASFTANATTIDERESVQFNFTGNPGNAPTLYSWNFGDGGVSSLMNPVHKYTTAGTRTVTLTVSDWDGDTNTYQATNYITVTDLVPLVTFGANTTSTNAGAFVQFTFTGTTWNDPVTYQWSFDDGTANATVQDPVHQFNAGGNFTITLTVVDDENNFIKLAKPGYVFVVGPPLSNYTMVTGYPYDWIPATGGIRCGFTMESDATNQFFLPFTFTYYDHVFNYIDVCTNGFISFDPYITGSNTAFPTSSYRFMIAPFWEDLFIFFFGGVYVANLTSPDRVVILYEEVYTDATEYVGNFEVVLYQNGDIAFNYDNLGYASDYTCGLNYGLNMSYFTSFTGLNASINDYSLLFTTNGVFSTHPADQVALQNAPGVNITWRLTTTNGAGDYRVLRNGSVVRDWQDWPGINADIVIPVSTTALGRWDYTIEYEDSLNNTGTPDTVTIIVNDIPVASSPVVDSNRVAANDTVSIRWTITDSVGGTGTYTVRINGSSYTTQSWQSGTQFNVLIDTGRGLGIFNYTLEFNDVHGTSGSPNFIVITIVNAPRSTHPEDLEVYMNALNVTITWCLIDVTGPGTYRILRNNSLVVDWQAWVNNTDITIPVNTSIGLGIWNYTIQFNNSAGIGNQDTVLVSVIEPANQNPLLEFLTKYWYLLVAGAAGFAIIVGVVVSRKRSKASSRRSSMVVSSPEKKVSLAYQPMPEKSFPVTQAVSSTPAVLAVPAKFYCQRCSKYYEVPNPDFSRWYTCTDCSQLLAYIKSCPSCNQPLMLTRDDFKARAGTTIQCSSCGTSISL